MATLKSRQHQIPNGFRFAIPQLGWSTPPFASFDSIVNAVTGLMNANLELAHQNNWPTEREQVAHWVEAYQVELCVSNGWTDYVLNPGTPGPEVVSQQKDPPLWLKAMKLLAKPEHKGLGDTVAAVIGHRNSAAFKEWYVNTFGKDCGCSDRQALLNKKFPY